MQIEGSIVSCSETHRGGHISLLFIQLEKFKRSSRHIDDDWSDDEEEDSQADKYDLPDPMLALRRGEAIEAFVQCCLLF